jgi:hypothetical protein
MCDTVHEIYEATINGFTVIKSGVILCRRRPGGECNFRSSHLNSTPADQNSEQNFLCHRTFLVDLNLVHKPCYVHSVPRFGSRPVYLPETIALCVER